MMEILAIEAQFPDYFVSHWWGEEVAKFLRCLERHCIDRGLEKKSYWEHGKPMYLGGRAAHYWVCGDHAPLMW